MDFLTNLPAEDVVFPNIFKFFSMKDLFRIRQVSRSYHDIVKHFFQQCSELDLSNVVKSKFTADAFVAITEGNKSLKSLNLSDCNHWITDDLLSVVISSNPLLEILNLTNCTPLTNKTLTTLGEQCKKLKDVSLKGCHWVDKESFLVLISNNELLEKIDVTSCWNLNDDCLIEMAKNCPLLVSVCVANCYAVTDTLLERLTAFCPEMEKVDVSGCWRVSDQGVRVCTHYMRKLKQLSVANCQQVTETSLRNVRAKNIILDVAPYSQSTLSRLDLGIFMLSPLNIQT